MKVKVILLIFFFYCLISTGFKQARAFQQCRLDCNESYVLAASIAQDTSKTLLSDSTVSEINQLNENQILKKEIDRLNKDLDVLQTSFNKLQKENSDLKLNIQQWIDKDNLQKQRNDLIEKISKEARESKAYYDNIKAPDLYLSAQNLLIIGNIEIASTQLNEFIHKCLEEINKSKNVKLSDSKAFFLAYSNYWVGRIENINGNYSKAVENFSESYKVTTNNKLSLISLVGLIESLSGLYKDSEVCIAVKQFNNDYAEALKNKKTQLDSVYLDLVAKFSSINKC